MVVILAVFSLSLGVSTLVSHFAGRIGLLDVPNERSSHFTPTPRGGGLGIFLASVVGVSLSSAALTADLRWLNVMMAATAVAAVGLWDDVRSTSARWRFAVHLIAAVLVVSAFPHEFAIAVTPGNDLTGPLAFVLSTIGIVCAINVFNFMDGTDGLAAVEAIFIAGGAALILLLSGFAHSPLALVCTILCVASCGFLIVNWSPARVFMGDVGSGFVGLSISALALWSMLEHRLNFWSWLILGGAFVADSTVTILRRLSRRENVLAAHRMHAYQRLARRWRSHRAVATLVIGMNGLWLLPLAALANVYSVYAPLIASLAVLPVGLAVWLVGGGLPDAGA